MYLFEFAFIFIFSSFFNRSHFGAPARRKAGMRKNSESQPDGGDALRRVQKTPMKAKGHVYLRDLEGKLQL